MMLCRIRFDDSLVFGMLANYSKDKTMAQSHATILLAGQPWKKFPDIGSIRNRKFPERRIFPELLDTGLERQHG